MKFLINLHSTQLHQQLPLNYQYPLSAAIYRILQQADSDYASFLHNEGYKQEGSLKTFKLFNFSDIKVPFKIIGDRLETLDNKAQLIVSFHLPQAAENFIKGLFLSQQIEIADASSKAKFTVAQVSAIPSGLGIDATQQIVVQPISPVVAGIKNEKGDYTFVPPDHTDFVPQLLYNWKAKYAALHSEATANTDFATAAMKVIFFRNAPKSRLITIKAGSPGETKIRGFTNFRLQVSGQKDALELLLNVGAGVYSSLGMGCIEMVV